MWISVLHHVCDHHEWLGGKCSRGELTSEERELPWFVRRDKDFEALQAIILEPSLLDSFKHYTRFRYTTGLLIKFFFYNPGLYKVHVLFFLEYSACKYLKYYCKTSIIVTFYGKTFLKVSI